MWVDSVLADSGFALSCLCSLLIFSSLTLFCHSFLTPPPTLLPPCSQRETTTLGCCCFSSPFSSSSASLCSTCLLAWWWKTFTSVGSSRRRRRRGWGRRNDKDAWRKGEGVRMGRGGEKSCMAYIYEIPNIIFLGCLPKATAVPPIGLWEEAAGAAQYQYGYSGAPIGPLTCYLWHFYFIYAFICNSNLWNVKFTITYQVFNLRLI